MLPLSSPAREGAWRSTAKSFYGNGSAAAAAAAVTRCFGSAGTATADSVIAAVIAAPKPAVANAAAPTAATSGAWKAGSIIATGNALAGGGRRYR